MVSNKGLKQSKGACYQCGLNRLHRELVAIGLKELKPAIGRDPFLFPARRKDGGHPVVDGGHGLVRGHGDDGEERPHGVGKRFGPPFVDPCEGHRAVFQREAVLLSRAAGPLPLVEAVRKDNAAMVLHGLAEVGLAEDAFGPDIDELLLSALDLGGIAPMAEDYLVRLAREHDGQVFARAGVVRHEIRLVGREDAEVFGQILHGGGDGVAAAHEVTIALAINFAIFLRSSLTSMHQAWPLTVITSSRNSGRFFLRVLWGDFW